MPTVRQLLPYSGTAEADLARVQAYINPFHKRVVLAAAGGDDGIFTFIVRHAFARAAKYALDNQINPYAADSSARDAFLRHISYGHLEDRHGDGADTRPDRNPVAPDVARATSHLQPTPPSHPSEPASTRKSPARRERIKQAVEKLNAERREHEEAG